MGTHGDSVNVPLIPQVKHDQDGKKDNAPQSVNLTNMPIVSTAKVNSDQNSGEIYPLPNCAPNCISEQLTTLADFTPQDVNKHTTRILSSWPTTTNQARELFPEFCAMYECIKE